MESLPRFPPPNISGTLDAAAHWCISGLYTVLLFLALINYLLHIPKAFLLLKNIHVQLPSVKESYHSHLQHSPLPEIYHYINRI